MPPKMIHAFITSCLANEKSMLYGLTDAQLKQLQRIRNMAAKTKNNDHILPVVKSLQWLPPYIQALSSRY